MKNSKKARINTLPMGDKVAYQCNCACPKTTPVEITGNKSGENPNNTASYKDDVYTISVSSE